MSKIDREEFRNEMSDVGLQASSGIFEEYLESFSRVVRAITDLDLKLETERTEVFQKYVGCLKNALIFSTYRNVLKKLDPKLLPGFKAKKTISKLIGECESRLRSKYKEQAADKKKEMEGWETELVKAFNAINLEESIKPTAYSIVLNCVPRKLSGKEETIKAVQELCDSETKKFVELCSGQMDRYEKELSEPLGVTVRLDEVLSRNKEEFYAFCEALPRWCKDKYNFEIKGEYAEGIKYILSKKFASGLKKERTLPEREACYNSCSALPTAEDVMNKPSRNTP